MLQDKNQGVYVEDIIENKNRFKDHLPTQSTLLPNIAPNTANSQNSKNSFQYIKLGKGGIPKPLTSQMYNHQNHPQGMRDNWVKRDSNSHRKAHSTLGGGVGIHDEATRGLSQEMLRKNQNNTNTNQYDLYYQQRGGFLPNH